MAWQVDSHLEISTPSSSGTLLLALDSAPAMPAQKVAPEKTTNKMAKAETDNKPVSKTIKRVPHKKTISTQQALPERQASSFATSSPKPVNNHPVMATAQETPATARPVNAADNQENEQQVIHARIQKQLHIKIAFNHHYPNMAIRRAWEGQVNLGIRVLASGELTNIHVIDSSGYSILDNAAMKSVLRVAALPEARQWLQGHDIDVILPIIYKLTDS